MSRKITVSSRALGPRLYVTVLVYETVEELRRAAERFNGNRNEQGIAVTQTTMDRDTGRTVSVIVRLACSYLGTRVVVHEMHHASAAWYGAHVGDRISSRHHLNHYNEPYAHLHSDLTYRLVDRLYALGFYGAN